MPPTDEEIAAITILLDHLAKDGSRWEVREYLDDKLPNEPTPEAIASNGRETAAIEVKRLIAHGDFFGFKTYVEEVLVPTFAGHYVLIPPFGYPLPWSTAFIRTIASELERAATELDGGGNGVVRVPRRANIAEVGRTGSSAFCTHGPRPLRNLAGVLPGVFYLVDTDQQHSFITDIAEADFHERVRAGSERRAAGEVVTIEWFEEWLVRRLDAETSRVEIVMPTPVFEVQATMDDRVRMVLESGARKFRRRRADSNILLIDSRLPFGDVEHVTKAIDGAQYDDWTSVVDIVLLLDGTECTEVFRAVR